MGREARGSLSHIVAMMMADGCSASPAVSAHHVGRAGGRGGVEREEHEKAEMPMLLRISSREIMADGLLAMLLPSALPCAPAPASRADLSIAS